MQVTDLKNLFTGEEKGVSPVIGVILMVAVTVILAAVIGAFVMNMGDNLSQNAPQANFNYDYDASNTELEVTHDGGDSFTAENTKSVDMTIGGTDTGFNESGTTYDNWYGDSNAVVGSSSNDLAAGDSITVTGDTGEVTPQSGDEVRVIWESNSGDSSQTVGSYTVP